MAIKARNIVERPKVEKPKSDYVVLDQSNVMAKKAIQGRKDKKIRADNKPKVKITPDMKVRDKKIRAEDKRNAGRQVKINKPVQSSQTSTREILKPSRYVEDLMR